jgi:hypothetical protein
MAPKCRDCEELWAYLISHLVHRDGCGFPFLSRAGRRWLNQDPNRTTSRFVADGPHLGFMMRLSIRLRQAPVRFGLGSWSICSLFSARAFFWGTGIRLPDSDCHWIARHTRRDKLRQHMYPRFRRSSQRSSACIQAHLDLQKDP